VYDPVVQFVYSSGRDQVSDVWVNGKRVLDGGVLTTIDLGALLDEVSSLGAKIYEYDHHRTSSQT